MSVKVRKRLIGKEKLLDIMAARLFAYSFLKRAFLEEPVEDYIKLLAENEFLSNFPGIDDNQLLKEGCDGLVFWLRDPHLLTDKTLANLAAEYHKLFGSAGKDSISPYESTYLSNKPLVFQEHTFEVRAEYRKHDLLPERFQREPDDHISLELDFMHKLTEKCMREFRANRLSKVKTLLKAEKDFLENHLMKWAPQFADKVIATSRSDFYRGAARMLIGYLQVDQVAVADLIKEVGERIKRDREKRLAKA